MASNTSLAQSSQVPPPDPLSFTSWPKVRVGGCSQERVGGPWRGIGAKQEVGTARPSSFMCLEPTEGKERLVGVWEDIRQEEGQKDLRRKLGVHSVQPPV